MPFHSLMCVPVCFLAVPAPLLSVATCVADEALVVVTPRVQEEKKLVTIDVSADHQGPVRIPRYFASLRAVHWASSDVPVKLIPETDHWRIDVGDSPNRGRKGGKIELRFEQKPLSAAQVKPRRQRADGSVLLPAHLAFTHGEKLRYEPQPHKNTVGYWTRTDDHAAWKVHIDRPGRFNVGILQGCGQGQGGSEAIIAVESEGRVVDSISFVVEDTGHFQNFVWRGLGTLHVRAAGQYELTVRAKKIAKNALMDVRQVHLSPRASE